MPLRILLVDDHAQSRYALAKLLSYCGHDVRSAATVAEAMAGEGEPASHTDVLICDIERPGAAALALMRQARAADGTRGIAMTCDDEEPADPAWRAAGYLVRLRKPLRFREVEAAIRKVTATCARLN